MDFLTCPLSDYLVHRFGTGTQLLSHEQFSRGSSRVTCFATLADGQGNERSIVLRTDPPGGSTIPTSLNQEFFVYDRLARTEVPVPRPLFWEEDAQWTTRPFYVREQIDGSWKVDGLSDPSPAYDALRIAISQEHMRKLAVVHATEWRAIGMDEQISAPADPASCAAHFIDKIVADAEHQGAVMPPITAEAVAWLKARAPVSPGLHLCKGTNGYGEEVLKDGVIVALCDWEEVSIGDPAADFAYCQNFVPEIEREGVRLWGLEQALAYYRSVGGAAVSPEAVRFYQTVRALSTIALAETAAAIVERGHGTIRQAWSGSEVLHLGKRLMAATMGLVPPVDPAWFGETNESIG